MGSKPPWCSQKLRGHTDGSRGYSELAGSKRACGLLCDGVGKAPVTDTSVLQHPTHLAHLGPVPKMICELGYFLSLLGHWRFGGTSAGSPARGSGQLAR